MAAGSGGFSSAVSVGVGAAYSAIKSAGQAERVAVGSGKAKAQKSGSDGSVGNQRRGEGAQVRTLDQVTSDWHYDNGIVSFDSVHATTGNDPIEYLPGASPNDIMHPSYLKGESPDTITLAYHERGHIELSKFLANDIIAEKFLASHHLLDDIRVAPHTSNAEIKSIALARQVKIGNAWTDFVAIKHWEILDHPDYGGARPIKQDNGRRIDWKYAN